MRDIELKDWFCSLFFFNDTATTEIYTLSLHDALPISFVKPVCPISSFSCSNFLPSFSAHVPVFSIVGSVGTPHTLSVAQILCYQ